MADSDMLLKLEKLQFEGRNYLYLFEPPQNNLFMVDQFYDPFLVKAATSYSSSPYGGTSSKEMDKLEYRVDALRIPQFYKFQIDTTAYANGGLRLLTAKPDHNPLTVDVTWREDAYYTIHRYHANWANHWYNRHLDCMVVGQQGKFRNMRVIYFHYMNVNSESAAPIYAPVPIAQVTICGMLPPESLSGFDFASSKHGNTTELQCTYTVTKIDVFFYPFFNKAEQEFIGGFATEVQDMKNFSGGMETLSNINDSSLLTKLFNTGIAVDNVSLLGTANFGSDPTAASIYHF